MNDNPMRGRWNQRHLEARDTEPGVNPWLEEHGSLLRREVPGRALDVACGRGGNAFFLADLGFEVEAVDLSDTAIEEVSLRCRNEGATLTARRWDLEADGLPAGSWSLIVMTRYLQRSLFAEMRQAVTPGGLIVIETFLAGHRGRGGKPFNPDFTLQPGELATAFEEFEILDLREEATGRRALSGIVVRRPAAEPESVARARVGVSDRSR